MFYNLLAPTLHLDNLSSCTTFRSVLAILISFLICFVIGPRTITYLQYMQTNGQPIRINGVSCHLQKTGTPTMGGIITISSTIISTLCCANLTNIYIWLSLFVLLTLGILGFIDDYTKISQNSHLGINYKYKLLIQFLISIIVLIIIQKNTNAELSNHITLPFIKRKLLDLGYFYIPFTICVIIGSSNAVNLTDGLDGLAIGTVAIAVISFAVISYIIGHSNYANYFHVIYIPRVSELTVLCSAIIGSSLGFLWYNTKPASIFMGDTGSLAYGGVLGTISVITKHELTLCIIGGVFVIETLSVILQVSYFKKTGGKRLFLMAPIHHHFEKQGYTESQIVVRFWILAIIFALIGLSSLQLG